MDTAPVAGLPRPFGDDEGQPNALGVVQRLSRLGSGRVQRAPSTTTATDEVELPTATTTATTPAPTAETPAPTAETTAPAAETMGPAAETTAPTATTTAPDATTTTPDATTTAPVESVTFPDIVAVPSWAAAG